jgi:hypothetical protein
MRARQISTDREGERQIAANDIVYLVILNLFQDNKSPSNVILKQVQDDETEKLIARLKPYFPVQFPGRFSTKAAMPSF